MSPFLLPSTTSDDWRSSVDDESSGTGRKSRRTPVSEERTRGSSVSRLVRTPPSPPHDKWVRVYRPSSVVIRPDHPPEGYVRLRHLRPHEPHRGQSVLGVEVVDHAPVASPDPSLLSLILVVSGHSGVTVSSTLPLCRSGSRSTEGTRKGPRDFSWSEVFEDRNRRTRHKGRSPNSPVDIV